MKHEITTFNTKKSLSESLKKFMVKKPFSKITVSEIIGDCGVNRKTFYYHFEDMYALLKWTLENEAFEVVKQFDLLVDYSDAILFVMNYVQANKHILNCAYDSVGRDELKRFFCNDFIEITSNVIDGIEEKLNLKVDENFKKFLITMYTEALAGMLVDWIRNKDENDKEKTIEYLTMIFQSSIPAVLKKSALSV